MKKDARYVVRGVAAVLCGIIASSCNAAGVPLEFKGVPIGAAVDQFKEALTGVDYLNCYDVETTGKGYCYGTTGTTYAGQHVLSVTGNFLDGRLAQVSVQTHGGSAPIITDALSSKYGKITRKYPVAQTLDNGIQYKMMVTEWTLPDGSKISIEDHPRPHDKVYTTLIGKEWRNWQNKSQQATKKAKGDI